MATRPRRAPGGVLPAEALERALRELADAHEELARRQSFTDALLETIEVGIVSCDADGRFVLSNRAERAMFGLETGLEGLLPEHLPALIDVLTTDGRPLSAPEYPLMRTLRGDSPTSYEVLVGPVGAPHREVVVRGSQIRGPHGELLGAVAALSDVTTERTAARALAEERRKLTEAQRLGRLGSFEHDFATGTWTFSEAMCELWGLTRETLTIERAGTLIHDADRALVNGGPGRSHPLRRQPHLRLPHPASGHRRGADDPFSGRGHTRPMRGWPSLAEAPTWTSRTWWWRSGQPSKRTSSSTQC